jgi:DNA-binding response OmpR family regulator
MTRILVVEDNEDLAFGLASALEADGYEVERAISGPDALSKLDTVQPDLVILDLMLPGFDGFRVLRTMRGAGYDAPVLVLTARGAEEDKVRGFRLGADDYVTKPFGALELLARVDALLRRMQHRGVPASAVGAPAISTPALSTPVLEPVSTAGPASASAERPVAVDSTPVPSADVTLIDEGRPVIRFGNIEVNRATRVVRRAGTPIALSLKEYDLLAALIDRGGAVATRAELLRDVWGYQSEVSSRTVDIHVAELRRKVEVVASEPKHILTVWKVGYRFEG